VQFRHINDKVTAAVKEYRPAISIDTKKKELVGEYKNGGREWRPKGDPVAVNVHSLPPARRCPARSGGDGYRRRTAIVG